MKTLTDAIIWEAMYQISLYSDERQRFTRKQFLDGFMVAFEDEDDTFLEQLNSFTKGVTTWLEGVRQFLATARAAARRSRAS